MTTCSGGGKKIKVIIAETVDWDGPVRVGSHHYANEFLAAGHEVLWMSQYLHPLSMLTGESERTKRVLKLSRGLKQADKPGLTLYTPISLLPCRRYKLLDNCRVGLSSAKYTYPPSRSVLKKLGFDKVDVIWMSNPLFVGLTEVVAYDALVFRCNDLYSGFAGMPKALDDLEKVLIKRADVTYATAKALMEHVESLGGTAKSFPNGVEFKLFNEPAPEPDEYADIPSPRVIYVGAIESWFDVDMMVKAAKSLPHISFVLVGSHSPQTDAMAGITNIHLLGRKAYTDVPKYMQHADAAIIPFQLNELTLAVNPNKLYEYFAAGLPVISTALPEVLRFEPLVKVAEGPDAFTKAVSDAVSAGKNDALREKRIQCAQSNSWKARFDEALEDIDNIRSLRKEPKA